MGERAWRVICEDGKTHTIEVNRLTDNGYAESSGYVWHADCDEVGGASLGRTPREAVQSIVRMAYWTPVEILAPGEKTREEAIAEAVRVEREACAAVVRVALEMTGDPSGIVALRSAEACIRARST